MARFTEDELTRRVVDTDSAAYRGGMQAANKIIENDYGKVTLHVLDAEVLMDQLLAEDPDVRKQWGMYLYLKAMLDTFRDYQRERST